LRINLKKTFQKIRDAENFHNDIDSSMEEHLILGGTRGMEIKHVRARAPISYLSLLRREDRVVAPPNNHCQKCCFSSC